MGPSRITGQKNVLCAQMQMDWNDILYWCLVTLYTLYMYYTKVLSVMYILAHQRGTELAKRNSPLLSFPKPLCRVLPNLLYAFILVLKCFTKSCNYNMYRRTMINAVSKCMHLLCLTIWSFSGYRCLLSPIVSESREPSLACGLCCYHSYFHWAHSAQWASSEC